MVLQICKQDKCTNKPGKKYAKSGFCGKHQQEALSLAKDNLKTLKPKKACVVVNDRFEICKSTATEGDLCGYHSKRKHITRYDETKAQEHVKDNMDRFLYGATEGRFSEVSYWNWYNGYGDSIFSGELEMIEDNQHEENDEDLFYYWSRNKIIADEVNIDTYADEVTKALGKVLKFDEERFKLNLIDYLESVEADKPANWDIPTYTQADLGNSLDGIPEFSEEPDFEYLMYLTTA